jgi:diguanylate cyclase (GGDEF)-like protein
VVTFPPDSLFHAYLLPLPVFFFLHLNRSPVYWRLLLSLMVLAFYVLVEFRWWPTGTVAGWPLYPMEASIQQVFRLTTTLFLLSGMLLFLTVFANGAAHVTRQLRLLASHDSLTGLINRRSVLDRLQHHLSLSDRYGDPLSLVLIDLDFFKQVNDRHGHHAGDEVLRSVGQLLREQTRKSDLCARFGGEEFLVVCPLTTAAQACQLAEKLGQKLRELEIQIGQGRITRVTGSFGVAEKGHASVSAHVFLQKADRALYAAKRAGRDRICLYDPARERTSIPQEP